jgi:hypothetical protein
MDGMDDSDHNTQSSLPAVVVPRPVTRPHPAEPRPPRWYSSRVPDQLRRVVSRHPAVASSLATAAGLMLHAGLRWVLTPQDRSARLAGSALTPTPPGVTNNGGSLLLFSRVIVVETWTVRDRRV